MSDSLSSDFLSQGVEDWAEDQIRIAPLSFEIDLIMDPKVKSFVSFLLSKSELFWEAGVSDGSEDYYPDEEYEQGGLALHVSRTIQTFMLLESGFFTNDEKDAAVAALLLRNITKVIYRHDEDPPSYIYDPFHVYTVDSFTTSALAAAQLSGQDLGQLIGISTEVMSLIFRLVRTSDGPESLVPETMPVTELERVVYYSCLVASVIKSAVYEHDSLSMVFEEWDEDEEEKDAD